METKRICPSCQKTLPPNVPLGLCTECLIKSGFNTGTEPGNPGKEPGFVPPPVAEIAKLFPQLEILALIGQGGMGAVYQARQPALDRFVALKILPPGVAGDPGFAERFNREARALARLNHPHIVAVHDFGRVGQASRLSQTSDIGSTGVAPQGGQSEERETGATPVLLHYLIMEFVDGLNLRQVEQAGRLAPEQALEIVPQICEALQFAHNEGIVHRDIKPENILLDKKGRVKITDFGIAKILGVPTGKVSLTGAKDVVGTPHYMAPEQIEKPQTVDHRADIYSLGVVFYELLTGELPLGRFAPPSKKVQVDVRLDEVVLHALEKEPALRYQHASEVQTDVETIAAGAAKPEVRNPAPAINAGPRAIDWRGLVRAWAVLFGVLATAAVLGWFHSDKSFSLPACLGAVFVLTVVVVSFGAWLVSSVTRLLPRPLAPSPVAAAPMPVNVESVRRQVSAPAIGLVVTGILNWLAIPLIFLVTAAVANQSDARRGYMLLVPLAAFVLSSVMIVAGLKMKRLEAYGLALTGAILAMLVTPGNVIGLPIGIWALVALSHREVRAAFGKNHPLPPPRTESPQPGRGGGAWKVAAVIVGAVMIMLAIPVGAILLAMVVPALNRARHQAQAVRATVRGRQESGQNAAGLTQRVLTEVDWPKLAAAGRLLGGVPVEAEGRAALKIENTNDAPLQVLLFKIEKPPITAMTYAITGEVKYENVQGDGYLEMWSYFPPLHPGGPEGQYFSRTLGGAGADPMGKITGTSGWRGFSLPFDRTGASNVPSRLEVRIFLPGRGAVFLGPVKLLQWARPGESPASARPSGPMNQPAPGVVIAETIREKIGRDLKEIGASFDELDVTMAEDRTSATPFKVRYRGLSNFRWSVGVAPAADGEFLMQYAGGGQWQGALGGVQFTVSVGRTDDFTLPFVNDPQVLGDWVSVDFVANLDAFDPDRRNWKGNLHLPGLNFREGGQTTQPWLTWTKGMVFQHEDKTASHYEVREIKGQPFLFFEWKSGDVTIAGRQPWHYVLRKKP